MVKQKSGLGKNMDSLFGSNGISKQALEHSKTVARAADDSEKVVDLPLAKIEANPFQPRLKFDEDSIKELAQSIKENGLLTPIIVRKTGAKYQIIAGERRFRATKTLKTKTITAIVRETNDETMATLALIENLQRDNLDPIEEARAYANLMAQLDLTQSKLADRVGKERTTVANALRLLKLPDKVQELVQKGELSMGQARALLGLEKEAQLNGVLSTVLKEGLNVRQVEALVKKANQGEQPKKQDKKSSPFADDLALRLEEKFGTKVKVNAGKKGSGKIEINYVSARDLERIMEILAIEVD
ncbi:ParB/RepB/Spo0J family partition protein [Fructobacillus sp. M1-13]|uniref:ParB/RepB/Spo0J family partition protein n=1 Tax=Fructobacillus papyriferae TaxID=2713171 RepID=A0ABS5QPL0_9LACO|nr:ParB/RepB/Spo0J family partition protein [Fructobacillus papyriferae]MBS9335119.1 ParB/RepB/Spo0J family partition protein [Fructobacillus papyriferae]MCD2159395.1 ParB/RepB/Spo0J family partition protein [Fructobacillus papyriferae]